MNVGGILGVSCGGCHWSGPVEGLKSIALGLICPSCGRLLSYKPPYEDALTLKDAVDDLIAENKALRTALLKADAHQTNTEQELRFSESKRLLLMIWACGATVVAIVGAWISWGF